MSTPSLTKHSIPGVLGPILIDVRSGARAAAGKGKPARPAVVVLHGFKGFKDWGMFPVLAERLAKAGMTAVSFNLSGSGVDDDGEFSFPERFGHATFSGDLQDLDAVIEALRAGELGVPAPTSLGLFGHSRGGGLSVLRAASDPELGALVTWSAVSTFHRWSRSELKQWRSEGKLDVVNARTGQVLPLYADVLDDLEQNAASGTGDELDIGAAAAKVAAPWLIVHGTQDETVDPREAQSLAEAGGAGRSESIQLLGIEGAGHTFGAVHPFRGVTLELDRAIDGTVNWMSRYLA